MNPLSAKRRRELRAEAHKLSPVVIIGDKGLTDEVVAEIDRSLKAHELVKVRAAGGERDSRGAWLAAICERLKAHAVQQIGKVLVIYRENPEEEPVKAAARGDARGNARKDRVLTELGRKRQRARDAEKRKQRDVQDMVRKGKIKTEDEIKRTSRPRSRTPSPLPESAPPRRRPRTSR
jgi:putative YhbY family RNA-binding protein